MSKTAWAIALGTLALFVLAIVASRLIPFWGGGAFSYGWDMGPWMMGPAVMGPWMMGGGIMMLLFWVLIIVGAIWLAQSLARGANLGTGTPGRESPLDILKARYAKGELNKEQYDEMKQAIGI